MFNSHSLQGQGFSVGFKKQAVLINAEKNEGGRPAQILEVSIFWGRMCEN